MLSGKSDQQPHLVNKFGYSFGESLKLPELPCQELVRMRDLILDVIDIKISLGVAVLDPALELRPHLPRVLDLSERVVHMPAVQF